MTDSRQDASLTPTRGNEQLPRAESDALGELLPPSRAIRQINDALSVENAPNGFLPAAENVLLAVSDDFTGKLGIEAVGIARSRNATAVDKQDILDADKRLRGSGDAEKRSWILAVAGFLGGGAAAALIAFLLAPSPVRHADYWWSCMALLGISSFILFFISYPRHPRNVRH